MHGKIDQGNKDGAGIFTGVVGCIATLVVRAGLTEKINSE